MRDLGLALRLFAGALLIGLSATPALALHRESQNVTRVTTGGPNFHPRGRHWSTNAIAFTSTTDLLGNGSVGQQLFVFSLLSYDCNNFLTRETRGEGAATSEGTPCPNPPRPALLQLTSTPAQPANPSLTYSETNQTVAFDADGTFSGRTGMSSARRQIYLMRIRSGEVIQVTDAEDGDSVNPSLTKSGTVVTFESTAALKGLTQFAGIPQIFAFRIRANGALQLIQVTKGLGPSMNAMPSRGASRIAFESTADLLGTGADTGVSQIFYADIVWDTLIPTVMLTQVTHGNAPSIRPYLADDGDFVVFESTATDLPGTNGAPGSSIYAARAGIGNLPAIQQITTPTPYGNCHYPGLGSAGDRLAFICDGDPVFNGTTGNRAFVLTLTEGARPGTLFQITGRGDVQGPIGLYMGRDFVTLSDNLDLTGEGVCDHQIQIVDFYRDPKSPTEAWHAASLLHDVPDDIAKAPRPPPLDSNNLRTHNFNVDPVASVLDLTSSTGVIPATVGPGGHFRLEFGNENFSSGEAPLKLPTDREKLVFPPIVVPSLGALCFRPAGPATGVIDCDGGRPGGALQVTQFHGADPADTGCVGGCMEGTLPNACPLSGPHPGVCRSDVYATNAAGVFDAGQMQAYMPLKLDIASSPDLHGDWCNLDNRYMARDLTMTSSKPFPLYLTTGTATGTIENANATAAASLTSSFGGVDFDCSYLRQGSLNGAAMIGTLPLLDLPGMVGGTQDVLLSVRLVPSSNVLGTCSPSICYNDADCDDLNPCTGVEKCTNHVCTPGTPPCDDGDVCNGTETCDSTTGACGPGTALSCDDASACTSEVCNPTLGCVRTDLCSDGDPCNGPEACLDPVAGTCALPGSGTPIDCDDQNPCTDDACQAGIGCIHAANTLPCDDGDLCTQNDTCGNNTCTGEPRPCSNGDACDGVEVCVPATGVCVSGPLPDCDDLNPCTDDSCDIQLGCVHVFNTAPCDDTNLCTVNDVCQSGVCAGAPRTCDDGNACNGDESCDPLNGGCVSGTIPTCDDQDECTIDSCGAPTGCTHARVPDYQSCRLTQIYLLLGQMAAQVSAASPASLGGALRQQNFLVLLQQSRQNVQRAATSTGKKFTTNVTRALRRLQKFYRLVRQGVNRGRVDPALANELTIPLQSIIATMKQLS